MKKEYLSRLIMATCLFIVPLLSFSQKAKNKDKFKFGNISAEELSKPAPEDTTAGAVVLFATGKSYFITTTTDMQLVYEFHKRIKINSKAGYDYGNGQIELYNGKTERETISNFSAATYNLVDGKIVVTKLEKDGIFDDKVIKSYSYKKFAMPDVKEGSIIEYKYKVYSPFIFNIRDWVYQESVPVRYSEYVFEVPDFFIFKKEMKGYQHINFSEKTETRQLLDKYSSNIRVNTTFAENLPAFRSEAYMTAADNFKSAIIFEISKINLPWGGVINLVGDWESITKTLHEDEDFGLILKKDNAVKDKVDSLVKNCKSDEEKILSIYDYVRKNYKWNEENSIDASQKLKKTIETKSGNSADINLLLTLMLKTAGLYANPVILSTREHGMIVPFFAPMIGKFNYTIAQVKIEGKKYLLDATDKWRNYQVLPERCLNGEGRVIYDQASEWVTLKNNESHLEFNVLQFTLSKDGVLEGSINSSKKSYSAFVGRSLVAARPEKEYLSDVKKIRENWDIKKFEVQNLNELEDAFIEKYDVQISNMATNAGDKIYLEPIFYGKVTENPFKMEARNYPVDFACPINKVYNCSIKLPEGYSLEQQLKPLLVNLPEKAGRFSFEVIEQNGSLQIRSSLTISKVLFLPDEYDMLKEFYNMIITKHAEQIVLKKI